VSADQDQAFGVDAMLKLHPQRHQGGPSRRPVQRSNFYFAVDILFAQAFGKQHAEVEESGDFDGLETV
jgi:hypothetical protein